MREILFRGKRKDNDQWVQGSLFAECSRFEIVRGTCNNVGIEGVDIIPETVGQYMGLTDKNGKKIFDGDIVKAYNICGEEEGIGVVHWSELFVAWHYANNKCMYGGDIASYEVIGNIHDNPELLGDK